MSAKQGYMVFYDTGGDGLASCSWGLYVCWGEEELVAEIARVLDEIEEEDDDRSDDIVITRIDDSIQFKTHHEEVKRMVTTVTLETT